MSTVAPLLDGAVVVSAAASLALVPRVLRAGPRPGRGGRSRGGRLGPEAALAAAVALVHLNQVLVAVYVNRVHGGDASFVARYLPPGWFDVPRLDSLAARFPAPELLAPSVLRVQAFLELPLVLLAFVSVVRRLDRALYVRLARSPLVPLAAVSYTVAFCAIEWALRNPYTVDDLVLRVLSAVAAPPLISCLAAREPTTPSAPRRNPFLFALDLWAYGQLMLVLYDTALLYNLARLGDHLLAAAAALAVLVTTRLVDRSADRPADRSTAPPAGPYVTTLTATIGRALALFLVPALSIRYAQTFASPRLAALAGLVVIGAAARRDVLRLLLPALAGAAVGYAVAVLAPGPYYEATLLRSATGALLATTALCALLDTSRARLVVRS
ncbi:MULTISPECIES: hypothetical protein [Streptomyces]|uniref:hypothetical protein n=1 Tax=Streptomyces TaxID=1883 RepID=UPI0004A9E164|nr:MULTISPECIES: hypothetical protein [Streptomyces]